MLDPQDIRETWVDIDLGALKTNLAELRRPLPSSCRMMAVMKASAYGHGVDGIARAAREAGADQFGVATVREGAYLRDQGYDLPIVVLSPTTPRQAPLIKSHKLTAAITSLEMADALRDGGVRVHVKVNTGMNRSGIEPADVPEFLRVLRTLPGLEVEGIFSHFAGADLPDRHGSYNQFDKFVELLRHLRSENLRPPVAHIANSAALLDMPEMALDMVRPGLALYGLYPSSFVSRRPRIRPVLSWRARVVEVRRVSAGDAVSYGGTYVAEGPRCLALLALGYADGYRRALSNRGEVLIRGRRCRVAGRVCMDLTVVDCADLAVCPGDEAVLIGGQGDDCITADEIAEMLGTINYEVTTQISARVPRIFHF